jgi:hypothetical protein
MGAAVVFGWVPSGLHCESELEFLFVVCLFCGAEDLTHSLAHARQVLYH